MFSYFWKIILSHLKQQALFRRILIQVKINQKLEKEHRRDLNPRFMVVLVTSPPVYLCAITPHNYGNFIV